MGVQTAYNFATPRGVAGGLYDLSPYVSDSRLNGETVAGALKFGMGVVCGTAPGANVKRPAAGATADRFDGIVMTGFTTEQDVNGDVVVFGPELKMGLHLNMANPCISLLMAMTLVCLQTLPMRLLRVRPRKLLQLRDVLSVARAVVMLRRLNCSIRRRTKKEVPE